MAVAEYIELSDWATCKLLGAQMKQCFGENVALNPFTRKCKTNEQGTHLKRVKKQWQSKPKEKEGNNSYKGTNKLIANYN